jgi:hypothetical protein
MSNFLLGANGMNHTGLATPASLLGGAAGAINQSAPNGALLGAFDGKMQEELGEMLKQELRQMKENRQMDELKHKGKLHADAGSIAQ